MAVVKGLDSKATVFTRIGWCVHYDPDRDAKSPVGGGAYNKQYVGHESFNFKPEDGFCYGFVRTQRRGNAFNLDRMFVEADEDGDGEDCLVVCIAPSPALDAQVVVGWYAHATCFAEMRVDENDDNRWWTHVATAEDCVLLPVPQRTWRIPRGRGGMGQSNVFYPLDESGQPRQRDWVDRTLQRIANYTGPNLVEVSRE